tara:strand:+ start:263 stop:2467 length:2205 start_codon:yes stop_codon:yes gene_type:complete
MYKNIIKLLSALIILLFIGIIYLSTIGIKTSKFNGLILNKIKQVDPRLNVELKEVSLLLDLKAKQIVTKTKDTNLYIQDNKFELSEINLNIDINSFLEQKYKINNLEIITKKNKIKNFLNFINLYKFNLSTVLLENRIKKGFIKSNISLVFDEKNGSIKYYNVKGAINNGKIKLLNNKFLEKINFDFNIIDKEYVFKNVEFEYEKIRINSEKIKTIKKDKEYIVEGDLVNKKQIIKKQFFSNLVGFDLKDLIRDELIIETNNNFKFTIDNKTKIKKLKIKSNLKYEKLILNYNSEILKNYFKDYNNLIFFKNGNIEIDYSKKSLLIKGATKYSFDKEFDNLNFNLIKKNNLYRFDADINVNQSSLTIKEINYKKNKKKASAIKIKGHYLKDKLINFDQISFTEKNNFLNINGIKLNTNYKIVNLNEIKVKYLNDKNKLNFLSLKKNKKDYLLYGETFDATQLIDNILKSDDNKSFFDIFDKLNSKLEINIKNVYLDKTNYLKNFAGLIKINQNEIISANLNSSFSNNDKFSFSIQSANNEKVTTLFSENAEPFVNKFDFIKGFSGGKIDFYSVKKNNISNSKIFIFDFNLKEVPALATLLSLASLQGIADLMTGDGIRFDEFEMSFENKDKLINIEEIYSIGPAISILMNGYIQKNELVSLRGTLVPATTINNVIGKIKILGNILVGSKKGEGVFGVSFKIKGPPKNLKTTVNPIKTLTPRFITRTLEKIKRTN